MKCCICGKQINNDGNNPAPVKGDVCCDECNVDVVIPLRLFYALEDTALLITPDGQLENIKPQDKKFTLKELQNSVDGLIEIYPVNLEEHYVIVNEEGLIRQMKFNSLACALYNIEAVGNVLICPKIMFE